MELFRPLFSSAQHRGNEAEPDSNETPEGVPSVLTVLNTAEAERNTEQNSKDNQGLFAAT